MIHVLGTATVKDYDHFLATFSTVGVEMRGRYGCTGVRVWQPEGRANDLVILYEWNSREQFETFRESPEVHGRMREAGFVGLPVFTVLEEGVEFET